MSSTRFVHLRLHSEFSVVDGIVRIDEAVKKAVRDGQGALALTDSANIFGAVRFYAARPQEGCQADHRLRPVDHERRRPRQPVPPGRPRPGPRGLPEPVRPADARVPRKPASQSRRGAARVVRGTGRPPRAGPDRAVRRASRRRGCAAACRQARARQARRPADGGRVPGPLLPRTAPHRPRARCRADPGRAGARRPDEAAGRRHASDPVPRTGRLSAARGARLHRRGLHARRSAPPASLHGAAVLQVPGGDGAALRRRAGRARQLGGDRAALQPRARTRQAAPAGLPDAGGHHARRPLPRAGERGPGASASRRCIRTRRSASASGPTTPRGSTSN